MTGTSLESNESAGKRLELLLFRLGSKQLFGINVFKVQEVIPYQALNKLPGSASSVYGVATLRGITMPVIDLSLAIGNGPMLNPEQGTIIITEYNRSVHSFLIHSVDHIAHTQWENVFPPSAGIGGNSYTTAITNIDNQIVQIIDVEKVLDSIVDTSTRVSSKLTDQALAQQHKVLVVDDSLVARKQIQKALKQVNVECTTATDGANAIRILEQLMNEGHDMCSYFSMIISDIEMPHMDGYMLTTELRKRKEFKQIYILLHSSISGEFNVDMVKSTGADLFIQKYCPEELVEVVLNQLSEN